MIIIILMIMIILTEESTEEAMDAVDMLRLMFDVELRLLAVGRFSRRTGWREGFQLYYIRAYYIILYYYYMI